MRYSLNYIGRILFLAIIVFAFSVSTAEAQKKKKKKKKPKKWELVAGVASSYDNNILKYSEKYLDRFMNNEDEGRFHIDTYDDFVLNPSFQATYTTKIFGKLNSKINVSLNSKLYTVNNRNHPAYKITSQIIDRLTYLSELSLGYISLDRKFSTLSTGEAQRLRLAGLIGSNLTGICYVLDEPTIGLHSSDTENLINILKSFCENGNTVVVVEHDKEIINAADNIIEIGPGAGDLGGEITFNGSLRDINENNSITGKYLLKNNRQVDDKPLYNSSSLINIKGANANNLKDIDIQLPENKIITVCGKSGTGKTSLVFDVIERSFLESKCTNCKEISFNKELKKVVSINSHNVGSSSTASILTYTGIFDQIRDAFAKTTDAKNKGFRKSHFSVNQKGGRCESCQGSGMEKISMDFLSDVYLVCDECNGLRFKESVLKVKVNKKSIYDILESTILELSDFFNDDKKIKARLETLIKCGLGYLKGGQTLNSISGGESQRLLFAKGLMEIKEEKVLFLLDEPSTGLHFQDVDQLLKVLDELKKAGHSIIIVEHNEEIINYSDVKIELGYEGGDKGGYLI